MATRAFATRTGGSYNIPAISGDRFKRQIGSAHIF
jgi:hypothetical protein